MPTYYVANYGSNSNNGTTPATPWATVQFALGAASGTNPGLVAGDTVWIAPGTYRESITSTTLTGTAGNTIKIYGDPKFTRAWSTGSAGRVRLTNYTSDTILPTGSQTLAIIGDYIDILDICFDGNTAVVTGPNNPAQACVFVRGGNNSITRCVVQTQAQHRQSAIAVHFLTGKKTFVVNQCVTLSNIGVWVSTVAQTDPFDINVILNDNLLIGATDNTILTEGATATWVGLKMYNNIVIGSTVPAIGIYNHSVTSATTTVLQNNLIHCCRSTGVQASLTSITITQSNNVIYGSGTFINILPTTTVPSPPMFDFGASRIQQFGTLPFFAQMFGSPIISAGSATGAPTVDLYGNTWTSTPTIGAIETKEETPNPVYQPTERNASAITIAPASTSQSIELYLGATGLTFATSGLAAYYVRNQSAPVAITLVTQTPTGAWTSGGFAEIDSSLVPGVYRLDVPNAAFAAGASDVTIVVRGASGTNGAVLTVTLSSGGLTAAQTAAAVWDEPYTAHTTASTFGARTLKTTVDNRPADVGSSFHIQSNVHAIVDSTAAADELKGALLHNGTDYISAELVTPVTSAALVRMGPFEVRADGLGASDPLDIQKGAQHGIDIQCVDNNGAGIDITSATVTAKVYNSGATLVDTYACTATYAADGRATFTIDTTVTNVPGTYTATITRTTGASDTQVFGPLRIYVRDI
jgi:hypothetical protein